MINEADLAELKLAVLSGITVGVGSQVLIFSNGVTILIQCPFVCEEQGQRKWGHGEQFDTSVTLFGFLNDGVEEAFLEIGGELLLRFNSCKSLRIVPEPNGLESYVLTTRFGICPVKL